MNGHVLRRPFGNEFSSTVQATGAVLPAVMGCPRRRTGPELVGGKGYRRPSWLWGLFDDGGTALTTAAVTPREQPPSGARWSCH